MADHERSVEPDDPRRGAGRNRRTGRFSAALTVGLFLLTGGIGLAVSGVFAHDQRATAQQHPDAEVERPTTTLRLLPTPADPEREDSPITAPASGRGTELFDSLPQRVGTFALVKITATGASGALEQYSGLYATVDDTGEAVAGQESVKLTVSRWGTEAEADDRVRQKRQYVVEKTQSGAEEVVLSGAEDGNIYTIADGEDLTILWSDFTTVGSVSGTSADVQQLFDEFSLDGRAQSERSR